MASTHVIATHAALPLMLKSGGRLVAGITDQGVVSFFHGFEKQSVMKMAALLAPELRPHGIAAVALTPGYLRSEAVLEHLGVTAESWRDGIEVDPYFAGSESVFYVGRAVAALAADRRVMLKTGGTFSSWELAEEYGFTDVDGAQPHWDRFLAPASDERWAEITGRVREEFGAHGLDPAVYVEDDRAGFTLRARLWGDGEPPRWYTETLSLTEVIYGSAERLAADFHQRYELMR